MIHYGLAERGDAPKPPNQAFSHWKDHRGGWVILVVHLAESADRDMRLFHVARSRRCTLRYLVSANYEKPRCLTRSLSLTVVASPRDPHSAYA